MSVPETPYTRGEMYLSAIADGDSGGIPERPYTRKEMYLDAIARGDSSGIPERPYTREEMYLDAIAKNGGGGGGSTLIDKNVSENGTYNASSDSADGYKKVVVAVPNSYAAGDEGKVVSNGALVAQSSGSATQNGTVDTTLINSLVVNVQGGGGYGYTKLAEADITAQTSSTTQTQVGTISAPGAYDALKTNKNKLLYIRVRDKAGARAGYFFGCDAFYSTISSEVRFIYKVSGEGERLANTNSYGVYPDASVSVSNTITLLERYHSTFSGIIDGTYHVEVYTLDWPDGVSPFATS